ncbi:MAG TPA: hypothetical protein VIU29_01570 [Candidatus Deferrimicrobiaceae bacterium]
MAVLRPLKVTIATWPEGRVDWVETPFWPRESDREGSRKLPLSREIVIEQADFSENPPDGWLRLSPGGTVRLNNACLIRCDEVLKDPSTGAVTGLRCSHDPEPADIPDAGGKRRKPTAIHWLSAAHAVPAGIRLYDRLCSVADPEDVEEGKTFKDYLNPDSVAVLHDALVEPGLAGTPPGERFQFVRNGYFVADEVDSKAGALVFNRIIELRDSYKANKAAAAGLRAARPKAAQATSPSPAGTVSDDRARARAADPSLAARHDRYIASLGLSPAQADVLTGDAAVADFFDAAFAVHPDAKSIANWVANDLLRELKGRPVSQLPFGPAELARLASMADRQAVTSPAAKTIFSEMMSNGGRPDEIAARLGLDRMMSDAGIGEAIDAVLAAHPDKVADYRAGKTNLFGMFTGHAMRAVGGKADPQSVQRILKDKLG